METEIELCRQEEAELIVTLIQAGCTIEELRAYFRVIARKVS